MARLFAMSVAVLRFVARLVAIPLPGWLQVFAVTFRSCSWWQGPPPPLPPPRIISMTNDPLTSDIKRRVKLIINRRKNRGVGRKHLLKFCHGGKKPVYAKI